MKRTYKVTMLVDVWGKTERDFRNAVKALRAEPPHLDVTSTGYDGPRDAFGYATDNSGASDFAYTLKTRKRIVSARRVLGGGHGR